LPDVVALEAEYQRLVKPLQGKYGSLTNAPAPLRRTCVQAQRKVRAKKEWYRKQWTSQLRTEFFVEKDNALIEAQLTGDDSGSATRTARKVQAPSIPERTTLANFIGAGDTRWTPMRAIAVQAMTDLCSRVEPRRNSVRSQTQRTQESSVPSTPSRKVDPKTATQVPMRCQPLQCLFCLGDERLFLSERNRSFGRPQALWKHAQAHLRSIDASRKIPCPHPVCKASGRTTTSVEHLLNHAHREHGIRLRAR
jgi:hypothetical protein